MTTVAVAVTTPDGVETVTTTPLTGMSFSAGEATVGTPVTIGVELHDNTNRIVGFGKNGTPVTPDGSDQSVRLDVRKPFVYIAGSGPIATIDSTRDPSDGKYQGKLAASGALAIPIDGTEIAVISGSSLQRVTTSDHQPTGNAIDIRMAMLDAAQVPGKRQVVVAAQSTVVLVDIDAGTLTNLPISGKPDRVTVGGNGIAYVLVGRVPPATGNGTCSGSSTVLAVPLDGSATSTVVSGQAIADIAAAGAGVYGVNPCQGKVSRLDGGDPALSMNLSGASSVAIEGVRIWAVGSSASVTDGASLILASAQLDGSDKQSVTLAPKTEIMTWDGDPDHEFTIDLHADTQVSVDLAVLPGGQTAAMIARMDSNRAPRVDNLGDEVIPMMAATVYDLVLVDTKSGAQRRIRDSCTLTVPNNNQAEFQKWSCGPVPSDETPAGGTSVPTAISALYGGR